jgi:hypothetical protein
MDGTGSTYGGDKRDIKISVGEFEGKRPHGRQLRRWEDDIRMDLREIGWEGVDWMRLAQDRDQLRALVNAVMNFQDPKKAKNFLTE